MMIRAVLVVLMAGLTSVAGCARNARPARDLERTVLEVDNRSFTDMTIYVVQGGQRVRMGTATALQRTDLTIPQSVLGGARQLSFIADPLGSVRTSVTREIHVEPGDRVQLILPP